LEHREPCVIAFARDRDDVMRNEFENQADERAAGRLVRRGNHAVCGDSPHETIRNAAEKDRLEKTRVIEKSDESDVLPWVWRRRSDEPEIVAVKDLAQVLQQEQHAEYECAS